MLQTRSGKRTGAAAVRIAVEMVDEGLIDEAEQAVSRAWSPPPSTSSCTRTFDPCGREPATSPASRVAGVARRRLRPGRLRRAEEAEEWAAARPATSILIRTETSPRGHRRHARGPRHPHRARGGMTSHAAVVARGMGTCCVAGCGALKSWTRAHRSARLGDIEVNEGDWLSLDGTQRRGHARQGCAMVEAGARRRLRDAHERGPTTSRTAQGAHQRRHARRTACARGSSAPRASASAAPNTCSSARTASCRRAAHDPGRQRPPARSGAPGAAPPAARRLRGHLRRHERPARDDPPARPAAPRVPAPGDRPPDQQQALAHDHGPRHSSPSTRRDRASCPSSTPCSACAAADSA